MEELYENLLALTVSFFCLLSLHSVTVTLSKCIPWLENVSLAAYLRTKDGDLNWGVVGVAFGCSFTALLMTRFIVRMGNQMLCKHIKRSQRAKKRSQTCGSR
ncbi:unnamed protein product [Hydatigera taeniaeformis]|uniref:Transmembrane protein n=1 Tax=Hydatigena taeniaeformis TaxID=6205 RepID=A0A0R3WJM9_HYDTA|nr:unnamed protein product [Hydatigera taeniaeformis]